MEVAKPRSCPVSKETIVNRQGHQAQAALVDALDVTRRLSVARLYKALGGGL
jgi:hypothetical protein